MREFESSVVLHCALLFFLAVGGKLPVTARGEIYWEDAPEAWKPERVSS